MTEGTSFGKAIVVGLLLFFVSIGVSPCIAEHQKGSISQGNWLYVGGSGPGNYTKIQDALDNASDGDTIYVYQGTYYENIEARKSISLFGEHQTLSLIDGQETGGHVVSILAAGVTLTGFTIRNSGGIPNAAALYISTDTNMIRENIITCIPHHGEEGIWVSHASSNTLTHNVIENHHYGIWLEGATHNNLSNNKITNSWDWAIILGNSDSNILYENNITENNGGLYLRDSDNNTLCRNDLLTNYRDITLTDLFETTSENVIVRNNIDRATFRAARQSRNTNIWDENYWGRPLKHPKCIIGQRDFLFFPGIPFHFPGMTITLPWVTIDWHPVQKPYDLEG